MHNIVHVHTSPKPDDICFVYMYRLYYQSKFNIKTAHFCILKDPSRRQVTDDQIQRVAKKYDTYKMDWFILGNQMGFSDRQLQGLQKKYPRDVFEQVIRYM